MLRRRVKAWETSDGVPVPLTRADDPVWSSTKATLAFLDALDLEVAESFLEYGPANRRKQACHAWARGAGVTRRVGAAVVPDWQRMRALGISVSGCTRERFRHLNSS